jgi:hypothetical protein
MTARYAGQAGRRRPPSTGSKRAGQPPPQRAPGPHTSTPSEALMHQTANHTATLQGAASLLVAATREAEVPAPTPGSTSASHPEAIDAPITTR